MWAKLSNNVVASVIAVVDGLAYFSGVISDENNEASRFLSKPTRKDEMKKIIKLVRKSPNMLLMKEGQMGRQSVKVQN
jgi:hypothetical protein